MVRIATKAPLHPRYWSTHEEYCFPTIKSLSWTQSRSAWSRFPLRSFSTKGGVSTYPAQDRRHRSTLSWRVEDVPVSHQDSKDGRRTKIQALVHSRTSHKAQHLTLTLSKELILALPLTKLVLSLRIWSICTWVSLEVFFNIYGASLVSSQLQMAGGHIYIYIYVCVSNLN